MPRAVLCAVFHFLQQTSPKSIWQIFTEYPFSVPCSAVCFYKFFRKRNGGLTLSAIFI